VPPVLLRADAHSPKTIMRVSICSAASRNGRRQVDENPRRGIAPATLFRGRPAPRSRLRAGARLHRGLGLAMEPDDLLGFANLIQIQLAGLFTLA